MSVLVKACNPEVCNGIDDNCNGEVDEGNPGGGAACMTSFPGDCQAGTLTCTSGQLVCTPNQNGCEVTGCNSDADCDDGIFCNGVERCVEGVFCVPGGPTCVGDCQQCDETSRQCSAANDCVTCVGDCNGDGRVTVDELVRGINIALGREAVVDCFKVDANYDNQVAVDELVSAVNAAVSGCVLPFGRW